MGNRRRWVTEDYPDSTSRSITCVYANYRSRALVVHLGQHKLLYPFALLDPQPSTWDRYVRCYDDERTGPTTVHYVLESGGQGRLTAEQVLDFHREPSHVKSRVLETLTMAASERIQYTGLSKRQIFKRLRTSRAQLDRILDTKNVRKSVDSVLAVLEVLGYEVEVTVIKKRH